MGLKEMGATLLVALNAILLIWAAVAYRRRQSMADAYYGLLAASPVIAAFQVLMGLTYITQGMRAPGMHIFYGCLISAGALAQVVLGRRTAVGHRYRARPLVHLFVALFVGLLSARAWMAA